MDITNCVQQEHDARYNLVVSAMSKYPERVKVIRDDCRNAVKEFEDSFFDFIYIDSNHEYRHVKRDIEDWYPKLKVGGIFSGHDYVKDYYSKHGVCGVKSAIDEFCAAKWIQLSVTLGTRRCPPSWYFVK
jgi:hypothetical protein